GSYAITAALGTLSAANYTFTFANGTLQVTPIAFTYAIGDDSQTYGTPTTFASLANQIDTGVLGQKLHITYSSTGAPAAAHVGAYAITGAVSNGTGLASNYTVTLTSGTLTVNPRAISHTIGNAQHDYGVPANFAPTFSTGVNGDTLALA